ncbi:enolase C-terminal domain-like protein [Streptomyces hyaluromycini]|uniref:enolase C-terminal domain-like protein n=1 Tax=Streptomyces hyaluromycini TaxID=1377993 RepID=UPI001FE3A0DA|nr:enolase C-terminal domain-like protein [Streptomyces hyaluromycini]
MSAKICVRIATRAMTQVAAAIPNPDTPATPDHPRNSAPDAIRPGVLELADGAVRAPVGPGLGVEIDHESVGRLHRLYLQSGIRTRDDAGHMRRVDPTDELRLPRC